MVEALQEPLPRTPINQLGTADKPRVLVMGGGGIAPGVVTATLSIVRGLLERGMQPLGLVGSWEGVQNAGKKWGVIDFEKIAPGSIDAIMHHGGTCLGPGRGMLKRDEFMNMRRLQHEIGFIGTAVVGGDGTLSGSQALQYSLGEDMRPVADTVACIKTIDGDAEGSIAIGFETSANAYAHAIKATIREVQWESGVGVIGVYGRDNGHLALHASTLAAQSEKICPVVTLVPEFPISREHFLNIVRQIKEKYGYVCIVASEGFAFEHEEQRIDTKKRDGAGNPKLLGCVEIIEEIIARDTVLQEQGKFSIRTLEPGIATRSCDPVESDIQLAKTVGEAVAKVIEQGAWGHVVNMQGSFREGFRPVVRPLWEVHTGNPVTQEEYNPHILGPTRVFREHVAEQNPVFYPLTDMSQIEAQKQTHEALIARIAAGELVHHNGVYVPQWAIQEGEADREKPTLWYKPLSQM